MKITVRDVRRLGGASLPGERCRYAYPGRVPEGCLEVYGLVIPRHGSPYLYYRLAPATRQAIEYARRVRTLETAVWEVVQQ